MFLKLWRYVWVLCLGIACSAWAENAPTLSDLGAKIKQNDDAILSQIQDKDAEQMVGYFDEKSSKMHKMPRENSQFARKVWGKNEQGDWILQDFYWQDETAAIPMTSVYLLPKKESPQRKAIHNRFQAAAFAQYRATGLPEKVMLFDDAHAIRQMYELNETGQVGKMFDLSGDLSMWLYHDNGSPKSHVSGANLKSWYPNGQLRLHSQQNGDSQMWHENGQLYYQNNADKVAFFYENGQLALELSNNQIRAWDGTGEPMTDNLSEVLQTHLFRFKQARDEILQEAMGETVGISNNAQPKRKARYYKRRRR